METFRVEQLAFSYPNIDKQALKNIDLTIESGEFVVICGK